MEEVIRTSDRQETVLTDLEELKKSKIRSLFGDWDWVVGDFARRVDELEIQRTAKLIEISEKLESLGVPKDDLPRLPSRVGEEQGALRVDQIKRILSSKMVAGEKYKIHEILGFLNISYARVRSFVQSHPDFIVKNGLKKGTFYTLKEQV
jgi:hypothetical protein